MESNAIIQKKHEAISDTLLMKIENKKVHELRFRESSKVSNDRVMRNYFLVLRSKADFDLYF
jgi:hypothetical protein